MRRATVFSVVFVACCASLLKAGDAPNINFDQGVDSSSALKQAKKALSRDGLKDFPPILERLRLPPHLERIVAATVPPPDSPIGAMEEIRPCDEYVPELDDRGSALTTKDKQIPCTLADRSHFIWGGQSEAAHDGPVVLGEAYEALPRDSEPYRDSEKWLAQVPRLPQHQRPPFESRHQGIRTTRQGLMADGRGSDRNEEELVVRVRVLNNWSARIDARRNRIEQDRANYSRECLSAPVPPDQFKICEAWRTRAKSCIDRHNASVGRYNPTAAQFRADRDRHFSTVDSFKGKVRMWEAQEVKPFNEAVQQALTNNPAGKCEVSVWESLVKRKDAACAGIPKPCSEDDHCADIASSMKANRACHKAAEELNEQCFESKHPEHSQTASNAAKAADACQAIFAKKCSGWDPHTGRCDKVEHERYQSHVDAVCGLQSSCEKVPFKECDILREFYHKNLICRDARDEINEVCYAGGDSGHRQARNDAQKAAEKCFERIKDDQCGSVR